MARNAGVLVIVAESQLAMFEVAVTGFYPLRNQFTWKGGLDASVSNQALAAELRRGECWAAFSQVNRVVVQIKDRIVSISRPLAHARGSERRLGRRNFRRPNRRNKFRTCARRGPQTE